MGHIKTKYTQIFTGSGYRPYLDTVFFYNNNFSTKTLSLMDSGADKISIGYFLGQSIGLPVKKDNEQLQQLGGIGGHVNYLERKCRIYIPDKKANKAYGFEEEVMWIYPDDGVLQRIDDLKQEFLDIERLRQQAIQGSDLEKHIKRERDKKIFEFSEINNVLNPAALLGRPFFNNFNHVQFCQRDKAQEDKCYFNIEIRSGSAIDTVDLKIRNI